MNQPNNKTDRPTDQPTNWDHQPRHVLCRDRSWHPHFPTPGRVTRLPALLHSFQHSVFLGVDDGSQQKLAWFQSCTKKLGLMGSKQSLAKCLWVCARAVVLSHSAVGSENLKGFAVDTHKRGGDEQTQTPRAQGPFSNSLPTQQTDWTKYEEAILPCGPPNAFSCGAGKKLS